MCTFQIPDNLKHDVESRLSAMASGQVGRLSVPISHDLISVLCYQGDGAMATQQSSYCHRVSQEEYDKQKNMSDEFLVGLLAKIVGDQEMPAKVKKKRLQQFEKAYPQLYRQYHSTPNLSSPDHADVTLCTSHLALR